ncbi:MAG: phosphotransferase enzyme family protein [Cypionkella sp.]
MRDSTPAHMHDIVTQALTLWGLQDCPSTLVAAREKHVYRVETPTPVALRLHRPGLRSRVELISELDWMAALESRGLSVPRPIPARDGQLCHQIGGQIVDVLTWLEGVPLGSQGRLNPAIDGPVSYRALGEAMARLHDMSDDWIPPAHFQRPAWNLDGLLGQAPIWGRFWENPRLAPQDASLLQQARVTARARLKALPRTDYGLIHADLVQENVLIGADINTAGPHLIDFDDGGYGYRLFDMATVLNHILREPDPEPLQQTFTQGYLSQRQIDLAALPLFQAIRAFSYVGWIVPRLAEPGADARLTRFVTLARSMAQNLIA